MRIKVAQANLLARLYRGLVDGRPSVLLAFSASISLILLSPTFILSAESRALIMALALVFGLYAAVFADSASLLLPVFLFVPWGFAGFRLSEWFAVGLAAAHLSGGMPRDLRGQSRNVVKSFLLFVLLTVPSLTNSGAVGVSLVSYGHLIVMLSAAMLIVAHVRTPTDFFRYAAIFTVMGVANSLHVLIYQGDEVRFFGFSGVMFIDYAGIGIIGCATGAFFTKGYMRLLLTAATAVLLAGLIATQTRNPIPVILGTGLILAVIAFVKNHALGVSRRRVVTITVTFLTITALGVAILLSTNSGFAERVKSSSFDDMSIKNALDFSHNTLLTRILIWDTAINAFKAHPLFGIGLYAFPRVSMNHATINELLYTLYVKTLSPHVGYLMIVCEAGVIGLIGFCLFLFSWFRLSFTSLRQASDPRVIHCRILALGATIYLILSLAVTDAWLLGNGAVLLGAVVGLAIASSLMNDKGHPRDATGFCA